MTKTQDLVRNVKPLTNHINNYQDLLAAQLISSTPLKQRVTLLSFSNQFKQYYLGFSRSTCEPSAGAFFFHRHCSSSVSKTKLWNSLWLRFLLFFGGRESDIWNMLPSRFCQICLGMKRLWRRKEIQRETEIGFRLNFIFLCLRCLLIESELKSAPASRQAQTLFLCPHHRLPRRSVCTLCPLYLLPQGFIMK